MHRLAFLVAALTFYGGSALDPLAPSPLAEAGLRTALIAPTPASIYTDLSPDVAVSNLGIVGSTAPAPGLHRESRFSKNRDSHDPMSRRVSLLQRTLVNELGQ
jgi:hypothetical protein